MSKIFVLRTDSLLSSIDSTMRFGEGNQVVIPWAVLEELQNYKGKPEKRKIADAILDYLLNSFDIKVLMNEGVMQSNGSILKVATNFADVKITEGCCSNISETDRRIFQVCLGLMNLNPKSQVILVSKDRLQRIRAHALGILAEDFRDDLFPVPSEQYTGRVRVQAFKRDIDKFFKDNKLPIECIYDYTKIDWTLNMFVEIEGIDSSNQSAIGRYDGIHIVPLKFINQNVITPKNVGQKMLMECLLTEWEDAPLVIVKGSAGTGKTICSLAAALKGVEEGKYDRVLVATPSETVGNEKLGFLPGDMIDKISPYLGGIKDNLSILLNNSHKRGKNKEDKNVYENGEYYFETGLIEVQPIGFLRGRTIVNTIFIIDETQNIDPGDIKSIVTRAAEGSKFIFLGDPTQVDNPRLNERYNGLVYLSEKMKDTSLCWQVSLGEDESVRSELSSLASKIL